MGFIIYLIISLIFLGVVAFFWGKDGTKMNIDEAIIFIIFWPIIILISLGILLGDWLYDNK